MEHETEEKYLGIGLERQIIATEEAPAAVGPYSQAVRVNNSIFTAGQIALDPATSKLVEGDIAAQTRRVLQNLSAVLEAAGSSLAQVIKTTVYLTDMDDFAAMNQVYAEFFPTDPPARTTVQVARLPLGARLEIEAIAVAE
jgi:2-iminobutanoate/2-iminopropanoate deaminase